MFNPDLIVIFGIVVLSIIFLLIYVRKIRQHNAKLKLDLAQANEKNNRLSNQLRQESQHNTDLKNELEQARQRAANLERRLATSDSSLDQSLQYSERLSGELTQANQYLDQARQRIANLERRLATSNSSLDQALQHYERPNGGLTQANQGLDQAHQRIANLERELATSDSSLDQSRQYSERLSGELTQVNQHLDQERQRIASLRRELATSNSLSERVAGELTQVRENNERLINNLRQEREDNANLKRKLENINRPAYQTILEAIYAENRAETATQKRTYLGTLQNSAANLWNEYRGSDISPDYSRKDYQEAYLLCYFLPYSQLVPYLLNHLILRNNFPYQPPKKELTASFFGCGPGPEIFGLMRYLGSYQPSMRISAAMLDREPWEHGRKIVRQLLDRTWNPDLYNIQEFNADIVGSPNDFLPADSEEWVKNSDLIVIQHCLNERHNAESEKLVGNMKQLVEKMKSGAVMLIIERSTYLQEFLGQFCYILQEEFSNSVDFSHNVNGEKIKPLLGAIPKELATNFLIDLPSNAVNSVEFIWMAIAKK